METYHWPGNVREFENWIEYADLPNCEELEKRYTQLVLERTRGNSKDAARILGTSISILWRWLKERDDSQKQLT